MQKKFLILFICFFVAIPAISQEKKFVNTPIKKVFLSLEQKHQVKFSFSDNLVDKILISIDLTGKSLNSALQEIQNKTPLFFQKALQRYIIVSDKNKDEKALICGTIYDAETQKPIENISVIYTSKPLGTITDKEGYFQLASSTKNDSLKISFLGYKTLVIPTKEVLIKPCKKLYLVEQKSLLNEIFITNYLTQGIRKTKEGYIEISTKKLDILPGLTEPDVLQSIQLLPGVYSPNETAAGLHIRGGTPDQNLILFDGIKMYNSAHFFGMISAFNPYITDRIKVFKSGAGANYGNHISGVIDIQTEDEIPKKTTGGFGFNLTQTDAFLKLKLSKKLSFSFSARRSITDVFNTSTFKRLSKKVFQNTIIANDNNFEGSNFLSNTDFYFYDFNSKVTYKPSEKDKIIINQLFVENDLQHNFGVTDNSFKTKDKLAINNQGFSSKWIRNWNEKLKQETSFYYSNYNLNYNFSEEVTEDNQDKKRTKLNTIKDLNFETKLQIKKNRKESYGFGYQFNKNNVSHKLESIDESNPDFESSLNEANQNNTHALFAEYRFKNNEKFTLQLGLRSNYFSLTNKFFLAPRIFTQVLVNSNFWIKSSAEFKQQNISQLLEFSTADFGLENQLWALSNNNDIPLLKSKQFTFGAIYKKNNWFLDVDFYYKNVTGITSLTKGVLSVNEDYSEGKNTIFGIDFLLQKKWRNYSSWFSYSFGDVNFMFDTINNGNSFSGNTDIRHNFLWSHNLKIGNYNFSLGWNVRTGVPFTNHKGLDDDNQIIYEAINSSRLPVYHKLDFSGTYSFNFDADKNWTGKIGLSLLNVYNNKNILQRKFSVQQEGDNSFSVFTEDTISLGFTPNFVFRVFF